MAREAAGLPLPQRLEAVTAPWLGRPYRFDPLGEGAGRDPDPAWREDLFDCVTFVEEALALALAPDPEGAPQVRRSLAYRDPLHPRWEDRRHFMIASWIPENVAAGWLRDVTPDLPGAERRVLEVSPSAWARWSAAHDFPLPADRSPVGRHPFHVLPLEQVVASPWIVPPGAILFVAREPSPNLPYAVTHAGIRLPGDPPVFRHASRRGRGRVRDEPLDRLARDMQAWQRWPVAGFIVLEPVDREAHPPLPAPAGPR